MWPSTVLDGTVLTPRGIDCYLAKYTAAGTLAWVRQLGSPGNEVQALALTVDATGNVYLAGSLKTAIALGNGLTLPGGTSNEPNAFVVRYSPLGLAEWAQQAQDSVNDSYGTSLGLDARGFVYLAGYFEGDITFGSTRVVSPGNTFMSTFLATFAAANGAVQAVVPAFAYTQGYAGVEHRFPRLAVSPNGEAYIMANPFFPLILGSSTFPVRGVTDVVVAKYSAQSRLEWAQMLGGPLWDKVSGAVADAAGNLYLTVNFTGPVTVGTTSLPGSNDDDGWLLKLSPQGTLLWTQRIAGPSYDYPGPLALDAAGNVYLLAGISSLLNLGPVTLTATSTNGDLAVASYTPQGQFRWATQTHSSISCGGLNIGVDASGDVHVLGYLSGSCTFGSNMLNAAGSSEYFLARLRLAVLSTAAARPLALACYPNPATTQVQLPGLLTGSPVQLIDALGYLARTAAVSAQGTVSVQGLAPGLYTLRATDKQGQRLTARLAVQ